MLSIAAVPKGRGESVAERSRDVEYKGVFMTSRQKRSPMVQSRSDDTAAGDGSPRWVKELDCGAPFE